MSGAADHGRLLRPDAREQGDGSDAIDRMIRRGTRDELIVAAMLRVYEGMTEDAASRLLPVRRRAWQS